MIYDLGSCEKEFGVILDSLWVDESKHCRCVEIPESISSHFINSQTKEKTSHIYMNRVMIEPFLKALDLIQTRGFLPYLKTFDGCFKIRDVRGEPGHLSSHSYAISIDLNAQENPLGSSGNQFPGFVSSFKEAGFLWGGDFLKRKDPMHFTLGW